MLTEKQELAAQALKEMSAEGLNPQRDFFTSWYTADRVAKRAGVSVSTARKALDRVSLCRGYRRKRFPGGVKGYRFDNDH
jgi:hypothetical protein